MNPSDDALMSVAIDWNTWRDSPASEWVDVTRILDEDAPRVPAFPAPIVGHPWAIPEQIANVTSLQMWCHVGTHVDAPLHFFLAAPAIDQVPLSRLAGVGVVWSVHAEPGGKIDVATLRACTPRLRPGELVFIDAGWSRRWGTPEYSDNPYLSTEAAQWLVDAGAVLVGVDFGTPDLPPHRRRPEFDFPVHHVLLGNGVLIAEHLGELTGLAGHRVEAVVAPLPIRDADGAPSRVLMRLLDSPAAPDA